MTKKTYLVADGVGTIGGEPVSEDRTVEFTQAQALYELALGRISESPGPEDPQPPRRGAKKAAKDARTQTDEPGDTGPGDTGSGTPERSDGESES